jgi:hypothetical protein
MSQSPSTEGSKNEKRVGRVPVRFGTMFHEAVERVDLSRRPIGFPEPIYDCGPKAAPRVGRETMYVGAMNTATAPSVIK